MGLEDAMPADLGLVRRARSTPDAWALSDDRQEYGWAEFLDVVLRTATALAARAGPQRPIGVCARNACEVVVLYTAAILARAPIAPLSFHLTAEDLRYIIDDAGCPLIFADADTLPSVLEARRQGGHFDVIAWRAAERTPSFQDWIAGRCRYEPDWEAPPAANLMYTSGTTGRPKGVSPPPATGGATLRESLQVGLPERGPHLVVGPLYHGGPMRGARHVFVGAPVQVMDRFDPEAFLRLVESRRIASSTMVPTHLKRLLDLPTEVRGAYDVSSLRRVIHTGASCPTEVKRAIIDWWGPTLYEYYGGTEAGTMCMISSEEWLAHPGSVGRPVPGISVRAVGPNGETLAPGEIGVLYFRHESGRTPQYRGQAAVTAPPAPSDGYFTLGEVGRIDDDGYIYITDRSSDIVLSGGVNIYPAEAERILLSDPRVADAACIGVPDERMGERLIALVQPSKDFASVTEDQLMDACRARLGSVKSPKAMVFVGASPRNLMGKVNRRALRDAYMRGELPLARSETR